MKTLIIAKKNQLFWAENLDQAFQEKQITSNILFLNDLGVIGNIKRNAYKTISKKLMIQYLQVTIEKKIKDYKPDIVMVISPFMFHQDIFRVLESFPNIKKLAWIVDSFNENHTTFANFFDRLFMTDSAFVEKSKEFNFPDSKYLPLAVNTNRFFNKNLQRENHLLFIASYTKQREEFLNQIDTIDVKLVGSKWGINNLSSHINCINKNISIDDVAQEYNQSKFILNIKHEHNVTNGLNMRTFEAIACGSCLLQDYVNDVDLNFEIDKDIVVYKSIDQLIEIIDKLNKDVDFYQNIVKSGEKAIFQRHTYRHRVDEILKEL